MQVAARRHMMYCKSLILVDVANCSVNAFTIQVHCLHPVLKVSNFLLPNKTIIICYVCVLYAMV